MSLVHKFAFVSRESTETNITDQMDFIEISDELIRYINDSLNWIKSIWNGKEEKGGISYYGFSVIKEGELLKLINIIENWKQLFQFATDEFLITGSFLPEENKYEKIYMKKEELLEILDSWIKVCRKALTENGKILHNGI